MEGSDSSRGPGILGPAGIQTQHRRTPTSLVVGRKCIQADLYSWTLMTNNVPVLFNKAVKGETPWVQEHSPTQPHSRNVTQSVWMSTRCYRLMSSVTSKHSSSACVLTRSTFNTQLGEYVKRNSYSSLRDNGRVQLPNQPTTCVGGVCTAPPAAPGDRSNHACSGENRMLQVILVVSGQV